MTADEMFEEKGFKKTFKREKFIGYENDKGESVNFYSDFVDLEYNFGQNSLHLPNDLVKMIAKAIEEMEEEK